MVEWMEQRERDLEKWRGQAWREVFQERAQARWEQGLEGGELELVTEMVRQRVRMKDEENEKRIIRENWGYIMVILVYVMGGLVAARVVSQACSFS